MGRMGGKQSTRPVRAAFQPVSGCPSVAIAAKMRSAADGIENLRVLIASWRDSEKQPAPSVEASRFDTA